MNLYTTDMAGNINLEDWSVSSEHELLGAHKALSEEGRFIAFSCDDHFPKDPLLITLDDGTLLMNPRESTRVQIEVGNKIVQIERKTYGVNVIVRRTGNPEGSVVQALWLVPSQ